MTYFLAKLNYILSNNSIKNSSSDSIEKRFSFICIIKISFDYVIDKINVHLSIKVKLCIKVKLNTACVGRKLRNQNHRQFFAENLGLGAGNSGTIFGTKCQFWLKFFKFRSGKVFS